MARQTAWILAIVLAYAVPASALDTCELAQQGHPKQEHGKDDRPSERSEQRSRWKWWLYDRAELGITDQQSAEIDQIFEATIPQQRETRKKLDEMETALAKMIDESTADEATIAQHVEQVEALRARANKTRTLLLYRMHKVLTAEQRAKVQALVERRREAERRRQPDSDRRR